MGRALSGLADDDPAFEHLRDIWTLTQDPDRPFEEKLELLFTAETEALELPYGFVSRTDPAADRQTIESAHGDHDLLQPGETAPLSESYCRHTLKSADDTFHVDDARAEGWGDDPAYERFGLGTYVGSVVSFDGQSYGTFCFAGDEPREEPLTEVERQVVELLATWVSRELSVRSTVAHAEYQTRQVEELATIVSHDLRNPLSVARGQVQLLGDEIATSVDHIEAAHQRMSDIVDDMLTLARVDEPVDNPDAVDLGACVADTWELVATDDATLVNDLPDGQVLADESRLRRLLENLFRNAVDHAGPGVEVAVARIDGGFSVADDGPGIARGERDAVFETGYSTVQDSTGFGLSIVRRIADAHDWDVTITDSETGGTRFEFRGVDGSLVEE